MIINDFFNYFQERIACVINPKKYYEKIQPRTPDARCIHFYI